MYLNGTPMMRLAAAHGKIVTEDRRRAGGREAGYIAADFRRALTEGDKLLGMSKFKDVEKQPWKCMNW